MMTASDVSAITKPWEVQLKVLPGGSVTPRGRTSNIGTCRRSHLEVDEKHLLFQLENEISNECQIIARGDIKVHTIYG